MTLATMGGPFCFRENLSCISASTTGSPRICRKQVKDGMEWNGMDERRPEWWRREHVCKPWASLHTWRASKLIFQGDMRILSLRDTTSRISLQW